MGYASTSKKPNSLEVYCELVDITGCCIRDDKADRIDKTHGSILERLNLDSAQRLRGMTKAKQLLQLLKCA
jgi:hypothetical protein